MYLLVLGLHKKKLLVSSSRVSKGIFGGDERAGHSSGQVYVFE